MKKKNYTLQLPEHLIHRLWLIRDITNKKVDPNKEIENFLTEMVEGQEKKLKLDPYGWRNNPKCNKCNTYMKKVMYKGKEHWGCPKFPDCKNLNPVDN